VGSSSLTRGGTWAPCIGSMDHPTTREVPPCFLKRDLLSRCPQFPFISQATVISFLLPKHTQTHTHTHTQTCKFPTETAPLSPLVSWHCPVQGPPSSPLILDLAGTSDSFLEHSFTVFSFFIFTTLKEYLFAFIPLAVPGLSRSAQVFQSSLQHAGSYSCSMWNLVP